jgi:hypothetical protein
VRCAHVGFRVARKPSTTSERSSIADLTQQLRGPQPCVIRRRSVECLEGAPNGTRNDAVANLVTLELIHYCFQKWSTVGLTQPPDCGTDLKVAFTC